MERSQKQTINDKLSNTALLLTSHGEWVSWEIQKCGISTHANAHAQIQRQCRLCNNHRPQESWFAKGLHHYDLRQTSSSKIMAFVLSTSHTERSSGKFWKWNVVYQRINQYPTTDPCRSAAKKRNHRCPSEHYYRRHFSRLNDRHVRGNFQPRKLS